MNGDAGVAEAEAGQGRGPSLLEEYISTTGLDDSKPRLENYVREYTSRVIRNVEAGIDLSSFYQDSQDAENTEPALIAIRRISPEYPRRARQRGLEGYSVVEYSIDRNGRVMNPTIIESSPGNIFNRSSIRAIEQYEFEPPTIDGQVVSLQGLQTRFVYQLKPG